VGALDEAFVVDFVEAGAVFIAKGEMWRIIEIITEKSRIKVEPISDPGADIPNWVGEEIPVPYEAAQEVGAIRKRFMAEITMGENTGKIIEGYRKEYPADDEATNEILELVRKQQNAGLTVQCTLLFCILCGNARERRGSGLPSAFSRHPGCCGAKRKTECGNSGSGDDSQLEKSP
jgi:Lhr-like helicase